MKTISRLIFWTMFIVLLLSVLILPVLAASPGQDTQTLPIQIPEAVLLLISAGAGTLCVKVVNFLKTQLKWTQPEDKVKNVWLTFGVAVVASVLLLLITSSFVPLTSPEMLVAQAGVIFSVATLLYKSMSKPEPETPAGP